MKTYQPTRAMLARFWVEAGVLRARLPKRMTWKRALEYSIAKWLYIKRHLENSTELIDEGGTSTCACCKKARLDCSLCPIANTTEMYECDGTPYMLYVAARRDGDKYAGIEAAEEEVDFLRRLYHMLYGEREDE